MNMNKNWGGCAMDWSIIRILLHGSVWLSHLINRTYFSILIVLMFVPEPIPQTLHILHQYPRFWWDCAIPSHLPHSFPTQDGNLLYSQTVEKVLALKKQYHSSSFGVDFSVLTVDCCVLHVRWPWKSLAEIGYSYASTVSFSQYYDTFVSEGHCLRDRPWHNIK